MKVFITQRMYFTSLFVSALLLVPGFAISQTVITGTVQASSIPTGNTVTINANGHLNMDVSKTFSSITTANAGNSFVDGTGALTVTGAITIATGNTLNLNPNCTSGSLTTKWTTTTPANISGNGTLTTGAITVESGTTASSSGWLNLGGNVVCASINKAGGIGPHNITYDRVIKVNGVVANLDIFRGANNAVATVEYNGAGAQTVYPGEYYFLTVTITVPRTITLSPTGIIYIKGDFIHNSGTNTYIITGSTLDFNGNGVQTIPAFTYNNLNISGYRTTRNVTLAPGVINVAGNFSTSNSSFSTGKFITTGNTVVLNGEGVNQTISGSIVAFNNLTINSSGTKSLGSSIITIAGSLLHTAGTMDGGTSTITFTGTGSIDGSAEKAFNNLIINVGATVTIPASAGMINITGNYTNAGTLTADAPSTVNFKGGKAQTLAGAGNTTVGNFITSNNSIVNAGTHGLKVSGSKFDVATGSTFNGQTNTVTFMGAASIEGAGTYNFNNLVISGSLSNNNSRNFTLSGNWTNNGAYLNGGGTVTLNGTTTQQMAGTTPTTFGNGGSGGLIINKASGGINLITGVIIDGVLTLTKGVIDGGAINTPVTISAAGSIAGATAASYISSRLVQTYTAAGQKVFPIGKGGVYAPVVFSYTSLDAPSAVSAEQLTIAFPVTVPFVSLFASRFWAISQTGASVFSYDLTLDGTGFSPSPSADLVIVKESSGTVDVIPASQSGNTYTATGLTSFSNFAIGTRCETPGITTQPEAPAPVCASSGSVTIRILTAGSQSESFTYQWQVDNGSGFSTISNGGVYSNATTASLTITNPALDMNGYQYRVVITSPCLATATSNAVALNVSSSPGASFTSQPGAVTCAGTEVTYTTQQGKTNYLWMVPGVSGQDFVIASGGTSSTDYAVIIKWLTPGSQAVTVQYTDGSCLSTTASAATTIKALPAVFDVISATTAPYCSGGGGTEVGLTGSETGVRYQLKKDGAPIGTALEGTGSALSFGSQTTAGTYTVEASWMISPACSVSMNGTIPVMETPLLTIVQGNATLCSGSTVHITGNVSAASGSAWNLSLNDGSPGAELNMPEGGNSSFDFAVSPEFTTTYTLVYSGGNGCPVLETISPVIVNVNPVMTPSVTIAQTVGNSTICAGNPVTFTATADGTGGGVVNYDFKVDNVSVQRSASNTFSTSSLLQGVHSVTCEIVVSDGVCLTIPNATTATPAAITVHQDPAITSQPVDVVTTYGMGNVSFSVTASGMPAPTYQWQLLSGEGFTDLPGETGSQLTIGGPVVAMSGNTYLVVVTNSCSSVTSDAVTLTVQKADPVITVNPYDVTYDGTAHTATGDVKGVSNELLSGLDLSQSVHTDAGDYSDQWVFTDITGNYNNTTGTINDKIGQASTITAVSISDAVYDGTAHGGGASVTGVPALNQPLDLTYTGINGTIYAASTTPPTDAGTYTASASFAGNGNFKSSSDTKIFTIAKADATIIITPYSGVYDGNVHTPSGTVTGVERTPVDLSTYLSFTQSYTDAPGGPADWTFAGNTNYNAASGSSTVTITQATARIDVTGYRVTYDGNIHRAAAIASGVKGEDLSTLFDLSQTSHTDAGTYNADPWTFVGNVNYRIESGYVTNEILKADAAILVTPYNVVYDAQSHTASATVTGVQNESLLSMLDLSSTTHVNAGTYSNDSWRFAGNCNYNSASGAIENVIGKALPIVSLTVNDPFTYDGASHGAGVASIKGVRGEELGTVLYAGTAFGGTLYNNTLPPTDAGNYNVLVSSVESTNYFSASQSKSFTIRKADASITITPYSGLYDGNVHSAVGTAAGVNGDNLTTLLDLSKTNHVDAGTFSDTWVFAGNGNYNQVTGTTTVMITPQAAGPVSDVYYTGSLLYWTPGTSSKTATINFVATLKNAPNSTGDITTAKVSFYIDGVAVTGAQNVPVSLVTPGNPGTGMASVSLPYNLGTLTAKSLHVSVKISGNYVENPDPVYHALVTVAVPASSGWIVGGGKLCNQTSGGYLKGAPDPFTTGFSSYLQYNKTMSSLQGNVEFYIRSYYKSNGTTSNALHTYKVKSASFTSLAVKNGKATISAKVNVVELVNGKEQSVESNCVMQLDLYDVDAPGASGTGDQVGITVYRAKGGIWFSNNWDGTKTTMATICGGNVSTTGSGGGILTYSVNPRLEDPTLDLTPTDIFTAIAYPNPTQSQFTIKLESSNDKDAVSFVVYSMDGKVVESRKNIDPSQTIQLGSLYRPGLYILQLSQAGRQKQVKLLKNPD